MKIISAVASVCILLTAVCPVASQVQENPVPTNNKSGDGGGGHAGAAITITILSAAAAGAGAYFGLRYYFKIRDHRDSVITAMEKNYSDAKALYLNADYVSGGKQFRNMVAQWDDYGICCKKRHREEISIDSVKMFISNCDLLGGLKGFIADAEQVVKNLPSDEDALLSCDRRSVLGVMNACRVKIDSLIRTNPGKEDVIRYGFTGVVKRLSYTDTLFTRVYDRQRLDFSLKSKFYYNRAMESKDTAVIRQFVEDCDHFQSDKQWCDKAREALEPPVSRPVDIDKQIKKPVAVDSISLEYQSAMESKSIDRLESYLKKYSVRKYRHKNVKLDSVRIEIDSLRKIIDAQKTYSDLHPLFADKSSSEVQCVIRGLNDSVAALYRNVLEENDGTFQKIQGLRFPAALLIDYQNNPPVVMLSAFVNYSSDVKRVEGGDSVSYSFSGAQQAMMMLCKIKKAVVEQVASSPDPAFRRLSGLINTAVYVLRLKKSNDEYVTFYSKDASGGGISYFDFYDLTAGDKKDVRFKNGNGGATIVLPVRYGQADSVKVVVTRGLVESRK